MAAAALHLIVITGSRANMIAVPLELVFLVLLLTNTRQKSKIVVCAVVFLTISQFFLFDTIHVLFSGLTEELGSLVIPQEFGSGSLLIRVNLIRNGLEFLYSTAGFGVGAGNAEYWMAHSSIFETYGILNPHNWWLEILINYGIFIFMGYTVFYLFIIRSLLSIYREIKNVGDKMICEALLVSLVGFFFASISSSSIMALEIQWLLFAFALAFINHARAKGTV
jgi:teichuronic acid biosynthesis protein TuaE